ncbi:MAG: serine/threonine-protein kinase [Polyangiaceae bacterium]
MTDVEERVEALVARGELAAAAAALDAAGQPARAVALYERACDFGAAARAAAASGQHREAVRLAVLAGDDRLCKETIVALVEAVDVQVARRVAEDLAARSYPRQAARVFDAIGAHVEAAEAYERAGWPLDAMKAYDAAGRPADGARVLEAAIRVGHEEDVDGLRVALGRLYARHGKHQAAVRVVQSLDEGSEHRRAALTVLARSLEALGLRQARRDLEPELARRGILLEQGDAPAQDEGLGTVLYGRYRVHQEVATTPHARLLEATDTLSGERVAVKILASKSMGTGRDALNRFVREAKALTQLRHPNVVPLRDFVSEGPAMILSWMGGGSLRDLLARETMSPARAAEIARAVLDALAEAHRLGILHRDIKPANILFDEGGAARLADFGAAHLASSAATVTVGAIGTAAYMSPEQQAGRAATVQSDLYAVGVLLHEMLTGKVPEPNRVVALGDAHPDLLPEHDALVARFLERVPDDRFASALDARRALEASSWPSRIVARSRNDDKPTTVPPPKGSKQRLVEARGDADAHDVWLGRDVLLRPLDDAHLARANPFARASHPALATVCPDETEARQQWLEAPVGRPLSQGLRLTREDSTDLRAALAALHRSGGHHGCIDADHVHRYSGRAKLGYPRRDTAGLATPERHEEGAAADRDALEALIAAHA